jgi:hypothetical protein
LHLRLAEQVPSDPWRVVLACDFIDPNGDLGAGSVAFYVNGGTTPKQDSPLAPLFAATGGLSPTATSGRVALPIRFAADTRSGSLLHLCVQLTDAAGHKSNCYGLTLQLNLHAAGDTNAL